MKKVLFVTNIVPPYRKSFYEKLAACPEYECLVLHSYKEKEDGRPAYDGELHFPNARTSLVEFKLGPFTIRWQQGVFKYMLTYKPDVVVLLGITGVITNWLLIILAKMFKIQIIMWTCGWEEQKEGTFALKLKQLFMRVYFKLPDTIILYSTKGLKYLSSLGINTNKMHVCYNGIEIDNLIVDQDLIRNKGNKLKINESVGNNKIFLYVGGMLKEKKIDVLLDSFSMLLKIDSGCLLWLVGDGPDRELYENYVIQHKIGNVKFWGRIVDDVDKYFVAANFFVLPGLGGLALNQAMFWQTPCIVSDADGTEDDLVIHGATGIRFDQNDKTSLFTAMLTCVNSSDDKVKAWGESSRKIIEARSNVTKMVEVFRDQICKLI